MFWNCAICTDVLDLSKPICFAPCGHLFHRGCLETWLLHSGTCPECRTSLKSANLKKVFPNGKILSEEMYIAHNVDAMQDKLREQKEEIKSLKKQFNDIKEFTTKFESEAASYKQKFLDSEYKLKLAQLSLKKMKPLEIENKNLKVELANLNAENELYKNVKTIIQGEQQEVNNIISECQNDGQTGGKESMQSLATFLAVLKREYNMLVITKNKLYKESINLKSNLSVMNEKYSKLQKMFDSAKVKKSLQREDVPISVLSNNCLDDSPISIKLMEKKKKFDVIVLDDNVGRKPSSLSACDPTEVENQEFQVKKSKVGFPIAVGPNLHSNGRTMIHPDPKLVRRIKLSKKIIK